MASDKTIRAWARREGLKVGERGRLHPDIRKAYENRGITGQQLAESDRIARESDRVFGITYDKKVHKYTCGFCSNGTTWGHDRCPTSTKNGSSVDHDNYCACALQNHGRSA